LLFIIIKLSKLHYLEKDLEMDVIQVGSQSVSNACFVAFVTGPTTDAARLDAGGFGSTLTGIGTDQRPTSGGKS